LTACRPEDVRIAVRPWREFEGVARAALRDVRAAVSNYRQPTLDGELATARSVLELAGIECHVEHDLGVVPGQINGLFAWTVREGVMNVVRHSGALRNSPKGRAWFLLGRVSARLPF